MPALEEHERLRKSRVESWRHLRTPRWNRTLVGDPVLHESKRYPTAELNPLGSRLLGLTSWQDPVEDAAPPAPEGEVSCAASA
ncbi:phytanoyl-CoA dioxygenase, partial [Streptomyces sp. SID8455]|nr:phytanoyl-CoA dioxygenase [Streptomyces sp. SID8455]